MTSATDAPTCKGRGSSPCQFVRVGGTIRKHEGQHYCPFHMPYAAPEKNGELVRDLLPKYLQKNTDLTGMQFPMGEQLDLRGPSGTVILSNCVFPPDCIVKIGGGGAEVWNCKFDGKMQIQCYGGKLVVRATFPHDFTLRVDHSGRYDFSGCDFLAVADIQLLPKGTWNFRNAKFGGRLKIQSSTADRYPQDLSFAGAKFSGDSVLPDCEPDYRAMRTEFAKNSDRESEGQFYALEKRCHRLGLSMRSAARWISALYDFSSEYGQSYERAGAWFLGLQILMLCVYALASGSLNPLAPFDSGRALALIAFTLSQIAKPFELLANRQAVGIMAEVIGDGSTAAWAVGSFLHSLLSLVLLALFVLALRWRFRRA